MNPTVVNIEGITKSYNGLAALTETNVAINEGELFGFIGPDGAGKTTLFRILVTLLMPDSGKASVLGLDVVSDYAKIRKNIGYMPGRFSLYQDLTVEENLRFFAGIHHTTIEENYYLIKDIYEHIEPFKHRRAGKLSGGMKQKLALSCVLIHKPKLLLLDEPTTGVDAVSRQEFWEMLKKLRNMGITILVSTPYMDEAALCDRVALMQKGSILRIETPEQIVEDFGHELFSVKTDKMFALLNDLLSIPQTKAAYRFGDVVHYVSDSKIESIQRISETLATKGHHVSAIKKTIPTIEDCFILLMSNENKMANNEN